MLIVLLPGLVAAQVTTSSIGGRITSASNVPVDGAIVKATHQPTGTIYTTVSQKDGDFTIPNMKVGGPYKIEINYVGYKSQVFDDIYLQLGDLMNITPA